MKNTYISKKNKNNTFNVIISTVLLLIMLMLIINPKKYINTCYNGLLIWVKNILPSLFPFMILTKILTELNIFNFLTTKTKKINKFLFNAPPISSFAFLISIISGYPIGAKTICDLYNSKQISSTTATKLTTFCSTSGPIFIIGTVGTMMFNDVKFGYVVYISHIISSVVNGIIFRNMFVEKENFNNLSNNEKFKTKRINNKSFEQNNNNENNKQEPYYAKTLLETTNQNNCYQSTNNKLADKKDFSSILNSSMSNSILSILTVGGFITISYILIDILTDIKFLEIISSILNYILNPLGKNLGTALCSGIIEITQGCLFLSGLKISKVVSCIVTTGIITFGGLSIHLQSLSFLSQAKVNIKFYFFQKITHTVIACLICIPIAMLML